MGDRRDEDIRNVGYYAAKCSTEVIIRHDKDMRGCSPERMNTLIIEGIHRVKPGMHVIVIPDEHNAIQHAMAHAPQGAFITIYTEEIYNSIQL